jgi:hypothetical protein
MKKITLCTVIVCFTINITAQSAATVSSTANASLLVAMSLSEASPLNFGSSLLDKCCGRNYRFTFQFNPSRLYRWCGYFSGNSSPFNSSPFNAAFNVIGTGLETYAVVLPSLITVWHTSITTGVHTMDINSMTARFSGANSNATTSTLASNGTDSFTLGATLNVQEDQIGGQYSGTFQVSVDYN